MESNSEILVQRVDGANGVIVVDPNAVVKDGKPTPRYVAHEDLMIYVEVRAFMNGKTKVLDFAQDDKAYDVITITKGVFYNSAQPLDQGGTGKQYFTTDWTNMFDENKPNDVEGFGISNIDIEFNASLIPSIHIEFIDVRGKNLLERGDDTSNPYNAFYVFPYPMFELIVKGYYGKAIRMPLIMEKAITKFDPSTGSYIISADFKSWTFAILNDLILLYALITPFMFKLPNGGYRGQEIIDRKYTEYFDLKGLSSVNRKINLFQIFTLSEKVSKVIKGGIGEKITKRKAAVDELLSRLKLLKDEIAVLAAEKSTNKDVTTLGEFLTSADISMSGNITALTALGYTEPTQWRLTDLINQSTYYYADKETPDELYIHPMPDAIYNNLYNPITKFSKEKFKTEIDELRQQFRGTLPCDPSVRNIVIAAVIHLDAFMDLLREKTEIIFSDIMSAKGLEDTLSVQNQYEVVEFKGTKCRRLPWPEYYTQANTLNSEFIKDYPGKSSREEVKNWGEVAFIEEMYKAMEMLQNELNLAVSGTLGLSSIFIPSALLVPVDPRLFLTSRTPDEIMEGLIAQIFMMEFHNGLLYKQTPRRNREDDEGILEYFVKNMVACLLPMDNLPKDSFTILNLLKTLASSLTNAGTFRNYVEKHFDRINAIIAKAFENQQTKMILAHSYYVDDPWLPTEEFKAKYFVTGTDSAATPTYQMSPMGVRFHPKALESLDLFGFNNGTDMESADGTRSVKALFFTNDFSGDDMFITRRY